MMPSKPAGAAFMRGWQESFSGQCLPGLIRIDRIRYALSGAVVLRE